jgi:hypothetical protein
VVSESHPVLAVPADPEGLRRLNDLLGIGSATDA